MKIQILAVGGMDSGPFKSLEADYIKRIQRFCPIQVQQVAEPGGKFNNTDEVVRRYSELLSKHIDGRPYALCDQRGTMQDSPAFAAWLERKKTAPPGELIIVVGGSHGVSEALYAGAGDVWSFSSMTFPHQLFRIMLLEQLYRGFSILGGSRYHK
jgi:23S rRNA (pseudouridine1915-N3)-methyltransferase